MVRGQRYRFIQNAGSHPFQIQSDASGSAYSTGVERNGQSSGNIDFNVQHDAPTRLYYQCTSHGGMIGNIYITGGASWQITSGTHTFTASAGSAVAADTTSVATCSTIEYTIFVSNSSNIQSQKVLIMDNGTTAYSQEFSVMSNPNLIATFSTDISSGNVRLLATPESGISGSTTIKFTKMIIE